MKPFVRCLVYSVTVWMSAGAHPFAYDLHYVNHGDHATKALVCLHGYGGDYSIGTHVVQASGTDARVISFNFPDYATEKEHTALESTTFGTINELLPAFYVIKQLMDQGMREEL